MNKVNHLISKLKSGDTLISKYDEIDFKNFDLKNVSFKYGDTHSNFIFKNLNLEIKKKDVIGIIGASGSGKSTLIDIISGMLKPEIGEIKINDRLVDPDMIAVGNQKLLIYLKKIT